MSQQPNRHQRRAQKKASQPPRSERAKLPLEERIAKLEANILELGETTDVNFKNFGQAFYLTDLHMYVMKRVLADLAKVGLLGGSPFRRYYAEVQKVVGNEAALALWLEGASVEEALSPPAVAEKEAAPEPAKLIVLPDEVAPVRVFGGDYGQSKNDAVHPAG